MSFLSRCRATWRNLRRRSAVEADLDRELRAYLDQVADQNLHRGMPPAEARRAAVREFGGIEQVKEAVRDKRAGRFLRELIQDVRYGARTLRKSPAFACLAILALALGIGINTAMFSVVYGVLFRPLPYPDAARIAVVCLRYEPRDFAFGTLSMRDFETWRAHNRVFEEPAVFTRTRIDVGGREGDPEQVPAALVSAGFFPALRTAPLLGRTFTSGEDDPADASLVVLGEDLWRRRFAGRPDVVGRTILIGGAPATVIGVMPRDFTFPSLDTEAWVNQKLAPSTRFGPWVFRGVARLKPGITLARAQAETNAIGLRLLSQNPSYQRVTLPVLGIRDWLVGDVRQAMLVLMGAVGLVLLVAIVNVASLVLARGTVRHREMALRLSLGAARTRLVRQLLVESVLLATAGGAAGIGLAFAALRLLRAWNPGSLPLMEFVRLDGGALLFTLGISLLTGLLFGIFPAWQASRADLHTTLKDGGRGGSGGLRPTRVRSALVVSQIALSLMLLLGAGLFLRSLDRLEHVSGGFAAPADQTLTMTISPGDRKYRDPAAGVEFYQDVLRRVLSLPGIESAAVSDALPPDRQGDADTFGIEGQALPAGEINPIVSAVTASPDYFRTLRIPLLRGRYFDFHDGPASPPVAVISESMARRFFPAGNALGHRLRQSGPGSGNPWAEIVGIVGDVKYLGRKQDRDSDAAYYIPLGQNYAYRLYLAVRASRDTQTVAADVRRAVQAANPAATVAQVATLRQALERDVAKPRFDTLLLVLFAVTAVLMAVVGIYGLIAFSVARRTREIGVRMALGARPLDVLRLVVQQALALAAIGIALGLAGAFAFTRVLETMLFGTSATDPATFVAVPLFVLLVVLLAAAIPARRAAAVSPLTALHYE